MHRGRLISAIAQHKVSLAVGLILLMIVACGNQESQSVVPLVAQVGSEQTGTVTLIPRGLRTEVVLKVNPGSPENDPQPVHIHFGNCGDGLGDVDVTLNDLAAGESVTLVDLSVSKLRDGDHAINLHKSYPEIRVYSACGNIPKR